MNADKIDGNSIISSSSSNIVIVVATAAIASSSSSSSHHLMCLLLVAARFQQCTVQRCLIDKKRSPSTTAGCSLSKTVATGI